MFCQPSWSLSVGTLFVYRLVRSVTPFGLDFVSWGVPPWSLLAHRVLLADAQGLVPVIHGVCHLLALLVSIRVQFVHACPCLLLVRSVFSVSGSSKRLRISSRNVAVLLRKQLLINIGGQFVAVLPLQHTQHLMRAA